MYLLTIFATLMFVNQIASQYPYAIKNRPRDNFVVVLNHFCPTAADNLDASCWSSLENFFLNQVASGKFFSKRHITGSDLLKLVNVNNYREENCHAFNQSETCILSLIKAHDSCIDQKLIHLKLVIGGYRTMCSNSFEAILSDVFEKVGDECVDDNYQEIFYSHVPSNAEIEEREACNTTRSEALIAHSKNENFDSLKTQYGARLVNDCLLNTIQRICGDNGKTQAKRITDMFLENLYI